MLKLNHAPVVVHPINAAGGLYFDILSTEGRASAQEIYDFIAPMARERGYDPDGRATLGLPCAYGLKACTYAVWFHTKLK
jgi:hypothetical protein